MQVEPTASKSRSEFETVDKHQTAGWLFVEFFMLKRCLQYFDTVGWASGRASGSNKVLA